MWTILIAICLVFVVCGPIWATARYLRVELPKFLLPMIAGITLFSYNIYMSYSWFDRTVAGYGDEIVVQKEYRSTSMFAPWTLMYPRVSHFLAVNAKKAPEEIGETGIIKGAVVMIQEYTDPVNMTVLADCQKDMISMLPTQQISEDQNLLEIAQWTSKNEFPYLMDYYCAR